MSKQMKKTQIHNTRDEWTLVAFAVVMPLVSLLSISI